MYFAAIIYILENAERARMDCFTYFLCHKEDQTCSAEHCEVNTKHLSSSKAKQTGLSCSAQNIGINQV